VDDKRSPDLFTLLGMGVTAALCLAAGLVVGIVLDDHYRSSPVFTLIGLAVGVVMAIVAVYEQVRRFL
jgi:hypothetical protein